MSLTLAAATYAARLSLDQIPEPVRVKARQAIRDHVACAVAGSQTDLGILVRRAIGADVDGPARLLGVGRSTLPGLAAFCNATAANALDFDDTSDAGHPGASIISAALAAATVRGCSGGRLLTGIIAGYEIGMRVASAIRPTWARYQQVHGIGTAQVFGAAAASSHILELEEQVTARAFGIAGTLAPVPHAGKFGWGERPLTWMKDNVAWPAEAGLRASLLAAAGMPAPVSILDGDRGFWMMAGSDRFEAALLKAYDTFHLSHLAFKPFPCCRWLHTALGAIATLQSDHEVDADAVHRVQVFTTLPVVEQFMDPAPKTMVDAQFSLPHAAAMKLLRVDVAQWWKGANRADPRVHALMARVEASHDPALTDRYLALGQRNGCVPACVELRMADGSCLEAYEELALGEQGKFLSEEDQLEKFDALTRETLQDDARELLLARLARLEDLDSLDELLAAL